MITILDKRSIKLMRKDLSLGYVIDFAKEEYAIHLKK